MQIHDCHIHMRSKYDKVEDFIRKLDEAGIAKAGLFALHPESFLPGEEERLDDRLAQVMDWAKAYPDRIVPFYWVDPLEEDALAQVDRAVEAGVTGFKVICNLFNPCDDKPMQVWERIAKAGKPILFHSGILYSPTPSSVYNRPALFEGLFDIPHLRFALAHVSWPWYDECMAVYGKWEYMKWSGRTTAEMFIDTTPGSPKIYRQDVFHKIYDMGCDVDNNVIFGTDCVSEYDVGYCKRILDMDKEALEAVGVTEEQRVKYYAKNYERFIGEV